MEKNKDSAIDVEVIQLPLLRRGGRTRAENGNYDITPKLETLKGICRDYCKDPFLIISNLQRPSSWVHGPRCYTNPKT